MTPRRWLIVDSSGALASAARLPPGSGILVLAHGLERGQRARLIAILRRTAARRHLTLVLEHPRTAARVHDVEELRRALLRRTPLVLLSPLYPTLSHPGWAPIPRMRAAALAGLARRRLIALGGMDERRFARVRKLGFAGWAGIRAWI